MKRKIDLALHSVDDLFTTEDLRQEKRHELLMDIPISMISDFPDHPYKVLDDDSMTELVESIKACGVIQPVIVRVKEDGDYEMVSGHRRKHACELAGLETMPCRIQDLTRDEAVISMVDSNLQRETILPSEKAKAYKMRLESMKRQAGRRSKENGAPVEPHYIEGKSRDILADDVGESREQIRRYIRLNELVPSLLDMVDEKRIALRPAVEISYLTREEQNVLSDCIEYNDATPSHAQTIKMRKFSEEGRLTGAVIESIMEEEKPNQKIQSQFRDERIRRLIPSSIPRERESDYVVQALEFYNRHRDRGQER